MPHNYNGNPNNVTTPLSRFVTSAASGAGGLVLIGTSGAHDFATYDYVQVSGVTGTTEANVLTTIQVIDSTHFLLDGTVFANPYSTGGVAEDLSLLPYFQLPDDGEAGTAQSIEASIQAIADRTQFSWATMVGLLSGGLVHVDAFLADGTWTRPPGVNLALLFACGGGGGGAEGGSPASTNNYRACGGAGGGGAQAKFQLVSGLTDPTYAVVIGPGGAVQNSGNGSQGYDGSATTFGSIATFSGGGAGGGTGTGASSSGANNTVSFGGSPVAGTGQPLQDNKLGAYATNSSPFIRDYPSGGGSSFSYSLGSVPYGGGNNPIGGFAGGGVGTNGSDNTGLGGGSGGGGGAGPFGAGASGQSGGNGVASGSTTNGTNGDSAAANTGAGGGGGGGGGSGGSLNNGNPGFGGAGGSGRLYVIWIGKA